MKPVILAAILSTSVLVIVRWVTSSARSLEGPRDASPIQALSEE